MADPALVALSLGVWCADDWEFPQTPGSLTGPVSSKLWASPAVSPLPPPQLSPSCAGITSLKVRAACRLEFLYMVIGANLNLMLRSHASLEHSQRENAERSGQKRSRLFVSCLITELR